MVFASLNQNWKKDLSVEKRKDWFLVHDYPVPSFSTHDWKFWQDFSVSFEIYDVIFFFDSWFPEKHWNQAL